MGCLRLYCCFNGYCIIFVLHIAVKRFEKSEIVKFLHIRGERSIYVRREKTRAKGTDLQEAASAYFGNRFAKCVGCLSIMKRVRKRTHIRAYAHARAALEHS